MNSSNEGKGIFQLPKLLKVQCSCSACDFKACLHTDQISSCYDCSSKSYLYYDDDEIKKLINGRTSCRESCIGNKSFKVKSLLKLGSSTTKLSSLIMNVPYLNFENSIPHHSPGPVANIRNMFPIDLLQKLKEVYKACSCKVCECISGKSERNQNCKCRPCQCDDCVGLKKKVPISGRAMQLYQADYLSPRFERASRKTNAKLELQPECECKDCECVQCAADGIISPCACKPCQCIECYPEELLQSHHKFIVANVANNNQNHQRGPSSPCGHIERGPRHGETSNLTQHEMSTGISRHQQCHCETCFSDTCFTDTKDICSCKRRDRVLNKPVQRDKTDFNICRALITQKVSCKDDAAVKPSNNLVSNNILDCKYSTLSMPFNTYLNTKTNSTAEKNTRSLCKSIYCDKMMATPCDEDICGLNGKIERYIYTDKVIHPINRREKLTPEMFSNETNRSFCRQKVEGNYFPSNNASTPTLDRHRKMELPDVSVDKRGQCNSQITMSNNVRQFYKKINTNILTVSHQNPHSRVKYVQREDTSKSTANAINTLRKKDVLNSQAPSSNSTGQSPISKLKCSGNSPQSDDNRKSRKSSCNSSGHHDSYYLIQFPKKTVKTDVNGILKSNAKTDITCELSDCTSKQYSIKNNFVVSKNVYDGCAKDLHDIHVPSRTITINVRKINKLNNEKCSLTENNSFRPKQANVRNNRYSLMHQEVSQAVNPSYLPIQNDLYNDGCDRVHKTLEDARQYSLQLVKLLEQYEKANKEFVSTSKILHKSDSTQIVQHLVSAVSYRSKNKLISDKNIEQANELEFMNYDVPTKDKYTDSGYADWVHLQDNKKDTVDAYVQSKQNLCDSKEIRGFGAILQFNQSTSKHVDFSSSDFKYSDMSLKDDASYCIEHTILNAKQKKLLCDKTNFLTKRIQNKTLKSYTKMYKRAVILSKRAKRFVPKVPKVSITTETSNALTSQVASHNLSTCEVNNQPKAIISNLVNEKEEAAVGDSHSSSIIYRKIKKSEAKTKQRHKVPENNAFCIPKSSIESEVVRKPPTQKKSSTISIIKSMSEIQALKSWYSKYQYAKDHESNKDSDERRENKSLANSCEALRVNFLTVQKVTDNKIVVKWNVPRTLENVKGYELLVDGRMEWKILNIYCGAVVVDCLPESNKMLLTVRTVLISPSPSGHVPSTTVVYTPNTKNPVITNHDHSLTSYCSSCNICLFCAEPLNQIK